MRAATEGDALVRVAEWMFLFRNQSGPDDPYAWRAHPHVEDSPLRPADVPDVLRMAEEAEGPASAAAAAHRVRRQPSAFRVYGYTGSATPTGFMAMVRLETPLPEDRAGAPVVAAFWDCVETAAPLGPGEHLGIRRFAVRPGGTRALSLAGPHQPTHHRRGDADHRTRGDRHRLRGRRAVAALHGRGRAAGVATVDVGGRKQHVFGRDWRRHTVEQRVRTHAMPGRRPDVLVRHDVTPTAPARPATTWPGAVPHRTVCQGQLVRG